MNHLTKREKEIIEHLKKDPMISQDELAAQLKITRSAVAVHISNLIHKGYILGRGYIFDERRGALVVGQIWLEIKVDQLGKIDLDYTGPGYQMATELLKYRAEPILLTVLGRDRTGEQIYRLLKEKQVNVEQISREDGGRTSKKLFSDDGRVISEEGCTISHSILSRHEEIYRNARVLLVDATLPLAELKYLAGKINHYHLANSFYGRDLFWYRRKGLLLPETFLVCSWKDLEDSNGGPFSDPEAVIPVAQKFVQATPLSLVITCGEQGVVLVTPSENSYLPHSPLQSSRSALSLTAGIAAGLASGYQIRLALRRAMSMKMNSNK